MQKRKSFGKKNENTTIYVVKPDYQDGVEGAIRGKNGFLRIIDINVKEKQIDVKTYSPYLREYKLDKEHQFSFEDVSFN